MSATVVRKFKIGDKVEMTDRTKACNRRVISQKGVVVGYSKKYVWEIRIHRESCKNPDNWHQDGWQLQAVSES